MTLASLINGVPPTGAPTIKLLALILGVLLPLIMTVFVVTMGASLIADKVRDSQVSPPLPAGFVAMGVLAYIGVQLLGTLMPYRSTGVMARIPEQIALAIAALPLATAALFAIMLAIVSRRTADVERGEAVRRPM